MSEEKTKSGEISLHGVWPAEWGELGMLNWSKQITARIYIQMSAIYHCYSSAKEHSNIVELAMPRHTSTYCFCFFRSSHSVLRLLNFVRKALLIAMKFLTSYMGDTWPERDEGLVNSFGGMAIIFPFGAQKTNCT